MKATEYTFRFVCAVCGKANAVYSFSPIRSPRIVVSDGDLRLKGCVCDSCFEKLRENCDVVVSKYLCQSFEKPVQVLSLVGRLKKWLGG